MVPQGDYLSSLLRQGEISWSVMLLGMLWAYAKERLAMDIGINPASDIARLHRRGWSHEPWPEEVIGKFEAEAQPGGGARTMDLTLPGFHHDFGSAVHPMAAGSPFTRTQRRASTSSGFCQNGV